MLRTSYRFDWIKQPMLVGSAIRATSDKKINESVEYIWNEHIPRAIRGIERTKQGKQRNELEL